MLSFLLTYCVITPKTTQTYMVSGCEGMSKPYTAYLAASVILTPGQAFTPVSSGDA